MPWWFPQALNMLGGSRTGLSLPMRLPGCIRKVLVQGKSAIMTCGHGVGISRLESLFGCTAHKERRAVVQSLTVSGWGPAGCWSGWGRWCIGCSYRHEDGRLHCTETDWPPIKAMPCPRFQVPHAPNPNPLHYTHKHRTPHSQCLMGVTLTLFLWPPGLSPLPLPLG